MEKLPSHHGIKTTPIKGEYPNETIQLLLERGSCRNFRPDDIPDDILDTILQAGVHAASGGNLQPFSIIVIRDRETKEDLAGKCQQEFIGKAPVNLLFCIDFRRLGRWAQLEAAPFTANYSFRHFWISFQDTIIAAQSICTAADVMGLGSVYIGTVADFIREVREMLEIPRGVLPVVLLALGYPANPPMVRKKLAPEVLIHREKYRDSSDEELVEAFRSKYPDLKVSLKENLLERFQQVCREVHGAEYAEKCLAKAKEQGYFNPVQRYFGLHYMANDMPAGNDEFLEIMKESGFYWFERFELVVNLQEEGF